MCTQIIADRSANNGNGALVLAKSKQHGNELLADAFKAAADKARELGWIV